MRATGFAAALMCAAAAVLSSSRISPAAQAQQAPVFRAAVDVIQVDVSVLDANGRPVRGLQASDFTLLENGQPQEIVAFAAIDVPAAPATTAPWLREVPPDVRTNALGDGRLFALVMDDATMPPDLRMAANARAIARQVVERMGPADLAAVVFVMDSRRSVDFTNDRARLLAAIDAFRPGFAYSDQIGSTDNQLFFASIRTLGLVAGHLSNVPQRRKAIIYVSTGAPVEPAAVALVGKIGPPPGAPALDRPIAGDTLDEMTSRDLVEAMTELVEERPQEAYGAALQDAFVRAEHGNVNIYSVDPGGVGGLQAFLQQRVRTTRMDGPLMTPVEAILQARLHQEFLKTVAEGSGGRAIQGTNDLQRGLERIFEENSSYYLLGYQATRAPADRTVRRVGVRVNQTGRQGLTARTRNAYFSNRPRRADGPGVSAALSGTLAGILPSPDVTLRATAAAFKLVGMDKAGLALATGVEQRAIGDTGARVLEQLDVQAIAYGPDGRPRGMSRQTARVALRAGLPDAAQYEVLSRIDLDPGRYQIRLAAHSTMTGKTGSVYFDVEVPDFNREPLQLSGLVLSVTPVAAAAPTDAAEAFLPVVPTSRRTFTAADAVLGFLRIYQGRGRPPAAVSLAVTITDAANRTVTKSGQQVRGETFVARAADVKFTVPVTILAPGEYLLTVDVTQDAVVVSRHARFSIAPTSSR